MWKYQDFYILLQHKGQTFRNSNYKAEKVRNHDHTNHNKNRNKHYLMKKIQTLIIVAAATFAATTITAAPAQDRKPATKLITSRYAPADIAAAVALPDSFRPVPRAGDAFWRDSLPEGMRRSYVEYGERHAGQPWTSLPATGFARFKADGNRTEYEATCFAKRRRLAALVMAEVAEGGGRFMPDIVDGLQSTLEETWWGLPAHYGTNMQRTDDQNVDLFNAETAGLLAWTAYMLAERLDSFSPLLRQRVDREIERRILEPAVKHNYWWKRAGMNWNPWIASNWLTCILLCEHDDARRAEGIAQIATALDAFIDAYPEDGGCDEGPGYWDRAAASLYECLALLRDATGGLVDMSREPKIRAMGSYIYNMYIGNGYCVNFADAHANRMMQQVNVVYPFGLYLGDNVMTAFAAYTAEQGDIARKAAALYDRSGNWPALGRELMMLRHARRLLAEKSAEPQTADLWMPDLQIMTARRGGMFTAMKGGNNGESHNHNDVGSFIVYADGEPLLIDPGVGSYTAKTFGSGRYDIWTMQSQYHNLPLINGTGQKDGREYAAKNASYARGTLRMDLAGCYPDSAAVSRWTRSVKATAHGIEVTEDYELTARRGQTALMLMSVSRPDVSRPGTIVLRDGRRVVYDPSTLDVAAEDISPMLDDHLRGVWGNGMFRIVMTVKGNGLKGKIKYRVI